MSGLHENLSRKVSAANIPTNRNFGFVFTSFFALLALWDLWKKNALSWKLLAASLVFLALTLLAPQALSPLNKLWTRFGLLLHTIVNPVVMALIFFVFFTPMALLMRALGKDSMCRRWDAQAKSYWVLKPKNQHSSMRNQF